VPEPRTSAWLTQPAPITGALKSGSGFIIKSQGHLTTSADVARSLASLSPHPFSADQDRRSQSIGTRACPCRREGARGSGRPRRRGKLVVQLGP
jgi:hypothetical protein